MNKKTIYSLLAMLLLFVGNAFAQDAEAEMADVMRQNGKIYTVVTVLGIILAGIFVYLLITERKLAKLEKQVHKS